MVSFLTALTDQTFAVEVGCQQYYAGGSRAPEKARKLWPSGGLPTSSTCSIGYLKGPIESGDFEKFVKFYRAQHPFMDSVLLQSAGGSVSEAIKIGGLLRRYLIDAEAPTRINGNDFLGNSAGYLCDGPDCVCASACALIWFGAPARKGRVGLHRPHSKDVGFGALSADAAAKQYQETLRAVSTYLLEMGAPRAVVEAMNTTSSVDIHWIDDGVVEGISMAREAGFDEWLRANCQSLGDNEYRTMLALSVANQDRVLSAQERNYLDQLNSQYARASACEHEIVSSSRDGLPLP